MTPWPPFHPYLLDKVESSRCPECGHPAHYIRSLGYPFELWGCWEYEPEAFRQQETDPDA